MHTKEGIFFEFERRLKSDTPTEFANDLQNVYAITRLSWTSCWASSRHLSEPRIAAEAGLEKALG
jgi:2-oxo-4-hydroxy-4-carboxy--5-ureidoimidazoline (OHCU) decarboxylase